MKTLLAIVIFVLWQVLCVGIVIGLRFCFPEELFSVEAVDKFLKRWNAWLNTLPRYRWLPASLFYLSAVLLFGAVSLAVMISFLLLCFWPITWFR